MSARYAIAFAALGCATVVHADDFYRGRTLSITVGASPSGSFDIDARAVARYLTKYIPGNPSVVVQNMPGAASIATVRYLTGTAPKDGTALGVFLPGLLTQALVTPEKTNVDLSGLSWLGVIAGDFSRVCYGYGPNGVTSWDQLLARGKDTPFVMGTTGAGASNYVNGMSLKEVLGANIRLVMGYPGATEIRLAAERGELDGDCSGYSGIPPDWIRNGKAHPFVRFAEKPTLGVPDSAVYVGALAKTDEQKKLLNFLYDADKLGRPFVVSKQIPPDRLEILRRAFDAIMKDKEFVDELARVQEVVDPLTGAEAEKIYNGMQGAAAETIAAARRIYQ